MDGEKAINAADFFLRDIPNLKVGYDEVFLNKYLNYLPILFTAIRHPLKKPLSKKNYSSLD